MLTAMRPITRMAKCTISRIRTEEMRSAAANMAGKTTTHTPPRPMYEIFVCRPTGIVAVVKATNVDTYYMSGNYNEALRASMGARQWCIISLILGLVTNGTAWSYLLV